MSRLDQNEDDREVVDFNPSTEPVEFTDDELGPLQSASSYGKRVKLRKAQLDASKRKTQVGGAPPLDPEKMQAIANLNAPQPVFGPDTNVPKTTPMPQYPGVGSAYQVNQEIAKGTIKNPVSLKDAKTMESRPTRTPLSDETIKALEKVKEMQEQAPPAEKEVVEDDDEDLKDAESRMVTPPMVDFEGLADAQRLLNSKARREAIEKNLQPLDIADMIVKREIRQTVTIIPGKLNYTFRTYNQSENLFCLRYVYDHQGSAAYAEELLNTCKLVCSLVAVNSAVIPEHRENIGANNEEVSLTRFEKKLFEVTHFPVELLADMSLNAIWFNGRVNKLFSIDNLKNG